MCLGGSTKGRREEVLQMRLMTGFLCFCSSAFFSGGVLGVQDLARRRLYTVLGVPLAEKTTLDGIIKGSSKTF